MLLSTSLNTQDLQHKQARVMWHTNQEQAYAISGFFLLHV